jgi:phage/plasmid-like protein (TIGR03299 family)
MAANVENLFYVDADGRHAPWHGLGVRVMEAPTSEDALHLAGLDWNVEQTESFIMVNGVNVPTGNIVNYRDTDNKILGTVSTRYKPVQNREAFEFTDELIGTGDVRYDTAGSLDGGRIVWLLAQMPETSILGDTVEPYLLFANSHDGSSAVRCTVTNVRVVCQNTLNFALEGAKRSFSFMHKGDIKSKLEEARKTIQNANLYNEALNHEAERLATKRFSREQVQALMDTLFPIDKDDYSKIQLEHLERMRSNFIKMMNADDLQNFKGTGWGLLNAASDYAYHARPIRMSETYNESIMKNAIGGSKFLDTAYKFVTSAVA